MPTLHSNWARSMFFPTPGLSLGTNKMPVLSQAKAFDPAHPADRLKTLLEAAAVSLLVTREPLLHQVPPGWWRTVLVEGADSSARGNGAGRAAPGPGNPPVPPAPGSPSARLGSPRVGTFDRPSVQFRQRGAWLEMAVIAHSPCQTC